MKRIKLVVAAVAFLVGLVAVSPSGFAETQRRQDARNDAPGRIDIWSAKYTHSLRHVRVTAKIPELGRSGSAALSISQFEIFDAGHVVRIRKRTGQPARVRLFYFNHFDLVPRRCADVGGVWGADEIRLHVARVCLDEDAQERVFVQFGIQRGQSVDRAPAIRRLRRN